MDHPPDAAPLGASSPEPPPTGGRRRLAGTAALLLALGAWHGWRLWVQMVDRARAASDLQLRQLLPDGSLDSLPLPAAQAALDQTLRSAVAFGQQPLVLGLHLLLAGLACWHLLGWLSPDWVGELRRGRLERHKVVVAALGSAAVLAAALWPLDDLVMQTSFPILRAGCCGAVLWLLWHRRGWLHPRDDWPYLLTCLGQTINGALVGVVAHLYLKHAMGAREFGFLGTFLDLGLYHGRAWLTLLAFVVALRAWGGLVVAVVAGLLAPPGETLRPRLRRVLPLAVVTALVAIGLQVAWRLVFFGRYRLGTPPAVAWQIPPRRVAEAERPAVAVLYHREKPALVGRSAGRSALGLPLDGATSRRVAAWLVAAPPSALDRAAAIQLSDTATAAWDPLAAVRAQDLLTSRPTTAPIFLAAQLETLSHCAYSPEASRLVARWVGPSQASSPAAAVRLARLAQRWGFTAAAQRWAAADPALAASLRVAPPRHSGGLRGRLLLDGRPLAATRVGVTPLLALPLWAGTGALTPWTQRLVSAATTTDAAGHFTLGNLFDGSYLLVVALSGEELPPNTLLGSVDGGQRDVVGGRITAAGELRLQRRSAPPPPRPLRIPSRPPGQT
ncbi:MAG: hypothetical protein IT204_08700 [Fimbriimonadaceae bacterium]|nr:hypothetical protein [Fimbriimonadaceae bacterium]